MPSTVNLKDYKIRNSHIIFEYNAANEQDND